MRSYSLEIFKQTIQGRRYKNAPVGPAALPPTTVETIESICRDMSIDFILPAPKTHLFSISESAINGGDGNRTKGNETSSFYKGARSQGRQGVPPIKNVHPGGDGSGAKGYARTQNPEEPIPSAMAPATATTTSTFRTTNISFGSAASANISKDDKLLQSLRICLNKITAKNTETQTQALREYLQCAADPDTHSLSEDILKRALQLTVDIASGNRFYADTFAQIIYELSQDPQYQDILLSDSLPTKVAGYRDSFSDITDVDPDKDYDAFCAVQKKNDARRAATQFFLSLHRRMAPTDSDDLFGFCPQTFLTESVERMSTLADQKGYLASVDDLAEQVTILRNGGVVFSDRGKEYANSLATSKIGARPSLSSRAIFAMQANTKN